MLAYTCESCGMSFTYQGRKPRWCPDDRAEGKRRRPSQRSEETLISGLARTVVQQRLAIEQTIHALACAALARQLGWDDRTWLDAALDALHEIPRTTEVAA